MQESTLAHKEIIEVKEVVLTCSIDRCAGLSMNTTATRMCSISVAHPTMVLTATAPPSAHQLGGTS